MILVAAEPQVTLFVIGTIYVLSGPFNIAYRFLRKADKGAEEQENII
jgi:hypothetical protein